jgi:hypothetical protein
LLNESRPVADAKAIGFRPSWKCEAWNNQRANLFVQFSSFSLVFLFLFFFLFFPDCSSWGGYGRNSYCKIGRKKINKEREHKMK